MQHSQKLWEEKKINWQLELNLHLFLMGQGTQAACAAPLLQTRRINIQKCGFETTNMPDINLGKNGKQKILSNFPGKEFNYLMQNVIQTNI